MVEDTLFAVWYTVGFFFWLIWLPAKVMKWKLLDPERGGEYAIKSLMLSHLVLINGVYLLSFLHIYKTSFLLLYLFLVLVAVWYARGHRFKKTVADVSDWMYHLVKKHYKLSIYIRRYRIDTMRHARNDIRRIFRSFFSRDMLSYLILFGSLAVLIYRRFCLVFSNYAYLTSDMYVHGDWINYLEEGEIFYDGVYPYGMHNMISAFHKLTGLQLNIVNRYWGPFFSILMIVVMYWFLKKTLKKPVLAVIPVVIYCISEFVNNDYGYRFAYTLGQETCMIFLLPMIYFMGRFIKEKNKKDAFYFSLAAGLMIAIHFYTAIMAVLLCFGMCVAFFKDLLNWKMIRMMLLQIVIIAVIGLTPMMVGLMQGRYWQGSTSWALSVVQGTDEEFKKQNNSAEKNGMDVQQDDATDSNDTIQQEEEKKSLMQRLTYGCQQTVIKQLEDMADGWGKAFWISMAFVFCYELLRIFIRSKNVWIDKMQTAIWVYLLLCTVIYAAWAFDLPTLMQELRIRMFLGYFVPMVLIYPFDIVLSVLKGRAQCLIRIGTYACSFVFAARAYTNGVSYQSYFYLEPSLAAKACVNIEYEFEDHTWTIVSPVDEIAMIHGKGYHYELWQFITEMDRYQDDLKTIIPTKDVFFILEKRPISYNSYRISDQEYVDDPLQILDAKNAANRAIMHVSEGGEMKYYANYQNRRILEAKLAAWIREYQKIYPDQFEVYMEDDNCIVYRFHQNELAWNNFAIPYGYNELSMDEYKKQLKAANEEYERTHPTTTGGN